MGAAIAHDNAAVALAMDRILHAFLEALCGIPPDEKRTSVDFSSRPPGVFGRARAYFGVSETTGKKVLHYHLLLWAGLPQWLSSQPRKAPKLASVASELPASARVCSASPASSGSLKSRDCSTRRVAGHSPRPPRSMRTRFHAQRQGAGGGGAAPGGTPPPREGAAAAAATAAVEVEEAEAEPLPPRPLRHSPTGGSRGG